jgi:hypothetical protein
VPQSFDLLSVDTDYYDYYILDRILQRYTPRVIVVEVRAVQCAPCSARTAHCETLSSPFWLFSGELQDPTPRVCVRDVAARCGTGNCCLPRHLPPSLQGLPRPPGPLCLSLAHR